MSNDQPSSDIINGVVSGNNEVEKWRDIPGYPGNMVSSFGNVKTVNKNGESKTLRLVEWKTTKGTYLYAYLKSDFGQKGIAVHRLVCQAFCGDPPNNGLKYEPNHIDGNKHNNRADNLEWVTRSQNIHHAFRSGLCTAGLRVQVKDLLNGTEVSYNTLSHMATEWNLRRDRLKLIISKHQKIPYQGRWLFKIDGSSDKLIKRHQSNETVSRNYITGQYLVTNDASEMGILTGINESTINTRIRNNATVKNKLALLGGYVFKQVDDKTPWPEYTVEEALASQQEYARNQEQEQGKKPTTVKNYITGEVTSHSSRLKAIEYCNFPQPIVASCSRLDKAKCQGEVCLLFGCVFKNTDDQTPWPEFSDLELQLSLLNVTKKGRVISVNDTLLNTTKIYPKGSIFAREIGLDPNTITCKIRDCKKDLFLDRYKIEFLT